MSQYMKLLNAMKELTLELNHASINLLLNIIIMNKSQLIKL